MITKTLADQVYEKLEHDILTEKYKRGEVITELSICESLGVSRTPVREALGRLEQDHLIENTSKGMTVLGMSAADIEIIYEIRSRIEGLGAAACAKHISEENLKELKDTVDLSEFYLSKGDTEKIKEMDTLFHDQFYKFSGSTVFYDTLMPLHRKAQKFRLLSVSYKERAAASIEEHKKIIAAIEAHDPVAAEKAANDHAKAAMDHLCKIHAFESIL